MVEQALQQRLPGPAASLGLSHMLEAQWGWTGAQPHHPHPKHAAPARTAVSCWCSNKDCCQLLVLGLVDQKLKVIIPPDRNSHLDRQYGCERQFTASRPSVLAQEEIDRDTDRQTDNCGYNPAVHTDTAASTLSSSKHQTTSVIGKGPHLLAEHRVTELGMHNTVWSQRDEEPCPMTLCLNWRRPLCNTACMWFCVNSTVAAWMKPALQRSLLLD